ncbi:BppU family phage baseplate upper protein [Pediococcus pentosaceus]|uniref:BppU family phage baseplate upper protein n=1 Tax=Pediococcus pentosaceus TaxID=1255 RepID=UPI00223B18D2|nr:BppU family phage baseplate upper protein [Pediococcus pentosaceus]MCS8573010.1 phage baseplate upper protein [Pediococcus pentosaceus]
MEIMTFNIDKDRRNLVDDKQNFSIDFHDSKYNWLQARQYEESMRQVEVHVVHGNGSPVDLTGVNPVFEGWMPEGLYRIIDAKHSVMIDAQNGIFRFDFPAPAFQIAGSYKQAFFRLMKDGKSVTTLEFSLEVLADKVISGLVPSDYITPFEDEYDKLIAIVEKADSKFAEQLIEWKNEFNKIIGDLNGDYIRIKSLADALDARLKTLEDKIKADGLLTIDEFNEFKNQIMLDVTNRIDILEKKIGRNYLKYKTVSATIYDNATIDDSVYRHLATEGAGLSLIVMTTITNSVDPSPVMIDQSVIDEVISKATTANVPITMLKPHIGLAGKNDSFFRGNYDPSDVDAFFDNWGSILEQYGNVCVKNSIPILCIGCEQVKLTNSQYLMKWQKIVTNLRSKYPDLLLTYAMTYNEFSQVDNNGQIAQMLDFIGLNVYPGLTSKQYIGDNDQKITLDELIAGYYYDLNGVNYHNIIDSYAKKYGKQTFITEYGIEPKPDGLTYAESTMPDVADDHDIQALGFTSFFEGLCQNKNVVGSSIWHVNKPFNFYEENTISTAEQVLIDYYKGGKI